MAGKAGAIRAGKAFVEIFADSSKLVRGLRAASAKLKAFGASVAAMGRQMLLMGGLVAAPLILATRTFATYGDQLDKMSKRTGISVEALSGLGFAARRSGASMETVEVAIRRMQRSIEDAGRGSKEAVDALAALGLSAAALKGLSPEEQFKTIAARLAAIADPTKKAALAMMLFGRSGTMLLPMLDDLDSLLKEAKRLGLIVSKEDAAAAAAFADAWGDVKDVLRIVSFTVGSILGKAITGLLGNVASALAGLKKFVKENEQVVLIVAKVAIALLATGLALVIFGGMISLMAKSLLVAIAILKLVRIAMLMLLAPVGLITTALLLVGVVILKTTGLWNKAISSMARVFGEFWKAIMTALAAGNITAAFAVVAAALKVIWFGLLTSMHKAWLNFWGGIQLAMEGAVHKMTRLLLTGNEAAQQAEDAAHKDRMANIERETMAKEAAAGGDLAKAREEYRRALENAKSSRTQQQRSSEERRHQSQGGGGGYMSGTSAGTFNPAAILSLQGGGDRMLKVNEDMLGTLKKIEDNTKVPAGMEVI